MRKGGRGKARRERTILKGVLAVVSLALLLLFLGRAHVARAFNGEPAVAPNDHPAEPEQAVKAPVERPKVVAQAEDTHDPESKGQDDEHPAADTKHDAAVEHEDHGHGGSAAAAETTASYAYLSIISNNKYVDGAMVLAYSLRKTSVLWKTKQCEMVLLVPGGLAEQNKARLRKSGWDRILDIEDDLAQYAPKAHFKDTFNKLYMFNLAQYSRVAYYDVDVLPLHNSDYIFDTKLPSENYVGAIGSPGDTYFKTGMMVLQPSKALFGQMRQLLVDGKYNHGSGRDGALLRDFFNGRFTPIDPAYSQYRRPWQDLKGAMVFHYRGEYKPWYEAALVPTGKWKDAERPADLGPGYRLWWEEYYAMHWEFADGEETEGWGGIHKGDGITPHTHIWLMRYTPGEYIFPVWNPPEDAEILHNKTTIEDKEFTCDTVCKDNHKKCVAKAKEKGRTGTEKSTICNAACQHFSDCHIYCPGQTGPCKSVCELKYHGNPTRLLYCSDRWPSIAKKKKKS